MINQKPVLLIDQDDVLAEYMKTVTYTFNEIHQTAFKPEDCNCWDLEKVFGDQIFDIMYEPELFRKLEPVPHALAVFERLYKSGLFEIFIVTAAHPASVEAKYEWIKEYLPFFPLNHIIICSSKYMVKGDFLLDDGMHNINAFAEHGGIPIIFNRPHNIGDRSEHSRINNWLEFEKFIVEQCYGDYEATYFQQLDEEKKTAV
ncbi:MAG: 5' nucleotidase, NT5C type [Cellulosilyticaceae bacterium]